MGRNKRNRQKTPPEPPASTKTPANSSLPGNLLAALVTALFVLRPLYPSESVAVEGDGLPVVMLWCLALLLWAILVVRGNLVRMRFSLPDLAMGVFVLWHSVAALNAVVYESPRPALNMLWEGWGLAIAFFLARQAFSSAVQRRAVASVMVALAVFLSLYGLYQYSVELPNTRHMYATNPDEMLRNAGEWYPPGSPEREAFEQRLASLEPMATFALTNSFAGFLAPWTIVVLGAFVLPAPGLAIRDKAPLVLSLVPLGLCLLLTKSRSAYLACMCGGMAVIALWWLRRGTHIRLRRRLALAGIAGALIVAAVAGAVAVGGLDVEVLSEAPKSLGYRLQYWQSSAAMIRDMPVMGCGPGNFQSRYTAYKLPEASEEIVDPHNFLLEIWATAGTPALLALLAIGGASCYCIFRHLKASQSCTPVSTENRTPDKGIAPQNSKTENTPFRKQPPQAVEDPSAAIAIYVGALVGVLLSIPVGSMSAAPPVWFVSLAAIPVGIVVLTMLRPWVLNANESPLLWTFAAAVLLIHLLFAGGITFPGLAGSLWLLVALALNASACGQRPASRRTGAAVLAGALVLLFGCHLTGYQPTLTARLLTDRVLAGVGDPRTMLQEAVDADPWATEPRRFLADVICQQWLAHPDPATMAEFDRAVQNTLDRAPRAATIYRQFGLAYCDCYAVNRDRDLLVKGIRLLKRATELYPNDCRKRADLADAYLAAGDQANYQHERDEALRLDQLTPHLDKKLSEEQRQRLDRNAIAPPVRNSDP